MQFLFLFNVSISVQQNMKVLKRSLYLFAFVFFFGCCYCFFFKNISFFHNLILMTITTAQEILFLKNDIFCFFLRFFV